MVDTSSTDEPDKYNRPFSPSERRILKALASNRDDYNRTLNKESKEVKYLKNATGPDSEGAKATESTTPAKATPVTPSNELEEIEKAMTCDKGCGHTVDYETCFKHQVEKIKAWSDQRCIEARKQAAKDIFNLAHEYAQADKTMIGSEELRNYHYFNAIHKIGEFDGR